MTEIECIVKDSVLMCRVGTEHHANTPEEREVLSGRDVQVQEGQPFFESVGLCYFPSLNGFK